MAEKKMRRVVVTAYPYASQNAEFEIPGDMDPESCEAQEYIRDHFNELSFDEPDLDYRGTEFDIGPLW